MNAPKKISLKILDCSLSLYTKDEHQRLERQMMQEKNLIEMDDENFQQHELFYNQQRSKTASRYSSAGTLIRNQRNKVCLFDSRLHYNGVRISKSQFLDVENLINFKRFSRREKRIADSIIKNVKIRQSFKVMKSEENKNENGGEDNSHMEAVDLDDSQEYTP